MIKDEIIAFLGEDWERMVVKLESSLLSDILLLDSTNKSILANGGKKLRPLVSLLMARLCSAGPLPESSYCFAAAVELLHNATLLHDDVADASDFRHGVPTVNASLGPTASVLVGDFWLVQTMKCVIDGGSDDRRIVDMFSDTLRNLAEGEMLQLEKTSSADTTEDDYYRIIYSKTASLFETACASAAVSVAAEDERLEAAKEYGRCLGMAFQIKDDILDYSATGEIIGKPAGIDLLEKKITLPLLGALANAGEEKNGAVRKMVSEMDRHPENACQIREMVLNENGIGYAEARLDEYIAKAVQALKVFPDCQEKEYLKAMAEFTASRSL